jgi:hypothetical protein
MVPIRTPSRPSSPSPPASLTDSPSHSSSLTLELPRSTTDNELALSDGASSDGEGSTASSSKRAKGKGMHRRRSSAHRYVRRWRDGGRRRRFELMSDFADGWTAFARLSTPRASPSTTGRGQSTNIAYASLGFSSRFLPVVCRLAYRTCPRRSLWTPSQNL